MKWSNRKVPYRDRSICGPSVGQNTTEFLLFCRIRMAAVKRVFFSIFMLKRPLEITQTDTNKIYPSLKLLQYDYIL